VPCFQSLGQIKLLHLSWLLLFQLLDHHQVV
jgi:hypothetical protein